MHASSSAVAACTVAAAHRRDHQHESGVECHPHRVEVVFLGRDAVAICHDCCSDSGFQPARDAELYAAEHTRLTAA